MPPDILDNMVSHILVGRVRTPEDIETRISRWPQARAALCIKQSCLPRVDKHRDVEVLFPLCALSTEIDELRSRARTTLSVQIRHSSLSDPETRTQDLLNTCAVRHL